MTQQAVYVGIWPNKFGDQGSKGGRMLAVQKEVGDLPDRTKSSDSRSRLPTRADEATEEGGNRLIRSHRRGCGEATTTTA